MFWDDMAINKRCDLTKAELLKEGIFFLIHLFARDVLEMKNLEIEKTKPTFTIPVLKVEYQVVLVFSINYYSTDPRNLMETSNRVDCRYKHLLVAGHTTQSHNMPLQ